LYLTKVYGILLKGFKKYGLNSLILVLIAIPDATKDSVLELEQYVLDTFQPEYNIQLCANSSAGRIMSEESKAKLAAFRTGLKHSEETKAPISASLIGEKNGRFNKGTPVYLYEVLPSEFELCASFPNRARASAILGIPASTPF
jgi:group I intron endonuclease